MPASPVLNNSCFSNLDYFSPSATSSPPTPTFFTPISTPELHHNSASRKSVHMGKINWARPLRTDDTVRILGTSMQRARRLKPSSPSSSSSDSSPTLPTTPVIEQPSLNWSAPEIKGLGVFGVTWDESSIEREADVTEIELASPLLPQGTFPLSNRSSYAGSSFNASSSIASSSSISPPTPTNLTELALYRHAAAVLETAARRPMKAAAPRERRIKRKPAPTVLQTDLPSCVVIDVEPKRRPGTTCYSTSPEITPRVGSLPFSIPERGSSSNNSDSESSSLRRSVSSASSVEPLTPTGTPPIGEKLLNLESLTALENHLEKVDLKRSLTRFLKI